MTSKSVEDNRSVVQLIDPAVINSDTNGASVDTKGFEEVQFIAVVGESADTLNGTNFIELEVEESADDSTFTDVANAGVKDYVTGTNTGTFAKIDDAAEDDAVYTCSVISTKRYLRPVLNFSGTHSTGTPIGVIAVLSGAKYPPVA